MHVMEAMKRGQKVRKKSWWWGRYIRQSNNNKARFGDGELCPRKHIPTGFDDQWEVYDEEKHGKHNRDPIDAMYEDRYLKQMGKL